MATLANLVLVLTMGVFVAMVMGADAFGSKFPSANTKLNSHTFATTSTTHVNNGATSASSCFTPAKYSEAFDPLQDPSVVNALHAFEQAVNSSTTNMKGGLSVGLVYNQRLFWTLNRGLINMADPARGPPSKGA